MKEYLVSLASCFTAMLLTVIFVITWLDMRAPLGDSAPIAGIDFYASAFTLTAIYLMTRRSTWAWPVQIVGCLLWAYFAYYMRATGLLSFQGVMIAVSIYGWWNWNSVNKS